MVEKKKKDAQSRKLSGEKPYCTGSDVAVPHPSTIQARRRLTSVIRRERVCSSWYSRRHDQPFCGCYCFATFRPICRSLRAIVSCSVMERGAVSG